MGSSASEDLWSRVPVEGLERDVRTTVLPGKDDTEDEHPYEWLADLLRAHTTGVGSLYVKDLDKIDLSVLETIVAESYRTLTSDPYTLRAREGTPAPQDE